MPSTLFDARNVAACSRHDHALNGQTRCAGVRGAVRVSERQSITIDTAYLWNVGADVGRLCVTVSVWGRREGEAEGR